MTLNRKEFLTCLGMAVLANPFSAMSDCFLPGEATPVDRFCCSRFDHLCNTYFLLRRHEDTPFPAKLIQVARTLPFMSNSRHLRQGLECVQNHRGAMLR